VHHVEREHDVVRPTVHSGCLEPDPVGHAGRRRVGPGPLDLGRIRVEAHEPRARVRPGQLDERPAGAAPHVGDVGAGPQRGVDGGQLRQPDRHQRVDVRRRAQPFDPAAQVGAVRVGWHAATGDERVDDCRQRRRDAVHPLQDRAQGRRCVVDGQHGHVRGRQGERAVGRVVGQVAGGRERRRPFAGVPLDDSRAGRELRRGRRPALGERPEQSEPVAEGGHEHRDRGRAVGEHPLRERADRRFVHGCL
jgi:hypothetical protein